MDSSAIKSFLLWAALLNFTLLIIWFLFLAFARDWVYRTHSTWHNITKEQFSFIHYAGMLVLKTSIFFFYLCPYLALCIVG